MMSAYPPEKPIIKGERDHYSRSCTPSNSKLCFQLVRLVLLCLIEINNRGGISNSHFFLFLEETTNGSLRTFSKERKLMESLWHLNSPCQVGYPKFIDEPIQVWKMCPTYLCSCGRQGRLLRNCMESEGLPPWLRTGCQGPPQSFHHSGLRARSLLQILPGPSHSPSLRQSPYDPRTKERLCHIPDWQTTVFQR